MTFYRLTISFLGFFSMGKQHMTVVIAFTGGLTFTHFIGTRSFEVFFDRPTQAHPTQDERSRIATLFFHAVRSIIGP